MVRLARTGTTELSDFVNADVVRQLLEPPNSALSRLSDQGQPSLAQTLCVSIYMPTHRRGADTRQDPIRLKNLLDDAEQKLTTQGFRSPQVRDVLAPARELIDQTPFWQHQNQSLAVFISHDRLRAFRLPIDAQESVTVNTRFHLRPLFPLLTGDGLFYTLAISQKQVRFMRCTRDQYFELDPEGTLLPQGIDTLMRFIEEQKQLQWHTQTGPAGGSVPGGDRAAVFHGQGGAERYQKDRIFEYFRLVVEALRPQLHSPKAPIIFAGVDHLFPIFQQAGAGLNLLDEHLRGNVDESRGHRADEIHRQAWKIIEPYFAQQRRKAIALYEEAEGAQPSQVAFTIEDAVRAAHDGRVHVLFVETGARWWGGLDPATGKVETHDTFEEGDEDLLDFAIAHSFIHDGLVYVLEREAMPNRRGPVAALLRF